MNYYVMYSARPAGRRVRYRLLALGLRDHFPRRGGRSIVSQR